LYNINKQEKPRGGGLMQYDTSVWRQAIARKKQEQEEKRCDYLSRVKEILIQHFAEGGADSVYICGSLLSPNSFTDESDIDIAVFGLVGNALRVSADLENKIGREIDLIELEHCVFRAKIEREGLKVL